MAVVGEITLTSDIQRALQHAVVEANNAFALPEKRKKRKKKRVRENGDDGDQPTEMEKKKKPVVIEEETEPRSGSPSEERSHRHKKKRKKDKGKEVVRQNEAVDALTKDAFPFIDPQLASPQDANSQRLTSAFLSALVAAASATSDTTTSPQLSTTQAHDASIQPQFPPTASIHDLYQDSALGHPILSHPSDPPVPALALSQLSSGSNEDILRALQDLDISKIANVLKTLTDAATAANVSLGPPAPYVPTLHPAALGQIPTDSDTILAQSSRQVVVQQILESGPNPDHAHLLASKWMNASKLAELVKTEGLVYKKGKFSSIEEQQLSNAIENYRVLKQLPHEKLDDVIFAKEKSKDNAFWSEITAAVPQRPIIAVYHHVRRTYHPLKQKGKWMAAEDALLRQAVADHGPQWEKISAIVGRMSSDCRDRYRNHIANRELRVSGQWSKEEEDELTRIVTEMTVQKGRDIDDDVFWGKVSERMGNRRGRQQCRIKWTDSLSKTVKNEGLKPRWSQQDAYILIHKIASMNVRDDTEIDWKTLLDSQWNLWSAHSLQRRWLAMKRSVKGHEDMTHQEIMDILRVKKAQIPSLPVSNRKRKIISAETIADEVDIQPEAGPLQTEGYAARSFVT